MTDRTTDKSFISPQKREPTGGQALGGKIEYLQ